MLEPWIVQFLTLAFRIDKALWEYANHENGMISYYYGPAELREVVSPEAPLSARQLLDATVALADALPESGIPQLRQRYLAKHLLALETICRHMNGERFSLEDEVRRCYDLTITWFPDEILDEALHIYDTELPGRGSRSERFERWRTLHQLPPDRAHHIPVVIEQLLAEARQRTRQHVTLPHQEQIAITTRDDLSYSAAIGYQGAYQSKGEINSVTATNFYWITDNICHEAYPGHHTEFCSKEQQVYNEQNGGEQCIWLQMSPQTSISEMIAQTARAFIFAPGELTPWLSEHVYPTAGIHPDLVKGDSILDAHATLQGAWCNAAFMLREGRSDGEITSYLERYSLRPDLEYLRIPFMDIDMAAFAWSKHILTTQYTDEERRKLLPYMINNNVLPSELRDHL